MGEAAAALGEVIGVVEEPLKQGARALLLRVQDVREFAAGTVVDIVPKLVRSGVRTIDPYGVQPDKDAIIDLLGTVFQKTAELTMVVSEDAAEVLTESVSEAFSNAAYSGIGGLVDAVTRWNVGAIPPQDWVDAETLSPHAQAFLDLLAGYMYHYTALRRIDRGLTGLRDDLLQDTMFLDYLESYRWAYAPKVRILTKFGEMVSAMVMRVLESVAAVLEALFARAEDAAQEYRATRILYEGGKISYAEYAATAAKVLAELDAVEAELDAVLEDLQKALTNWSPTVPSGLDNLNDMIRDMLDGEEDSIAETLGEWLADLDAARVAGRPAKRAYYFQVNTRKKIVQAGGGQR